MLVVVKMSSVAVDLIWTNYQETKGNVLVIVTKYCWWYECK